MYICIYIYIYTYYTHEYHILHIHVCVCIYIYIYIYIYISTRCLAGRTLYEEHPVRLLRVWISKGLTQADS